MTHERDMKHKLELTGNDGAFLEGGHELKTVFEYNDEFFEHGIGNYGETDIEFLLNELARDISQDIYNYMEEAMEAAEENGEDSEKAWEDLHDENDVFHYTCDEGYWKVSIDSFYRVTDGIALTTGQAIMPHLREEVEAYIASQA